MCEAERRKAGAASSKIKQFEHLGTKKLPGDGYVDFSCTSLFLRPKDPAAGKMMPQISNLLLTTTGLSAVHIPLSSD